MVRLLQVTLSGLRLPLFCVRSECVMGRIRLECNTNWFVQKTGLETQLTQQLQIPAYAYADWYDGLCQMDCARPFWLGSPQIKSK